MPEHEYTGDPRPTSPDDDDDDIPEPEEDNE